MSSTITITTTQTSIPPPNLLGQSIRLAKAHRRRYQTSNDIIDAARLGMSMIVVQTFPLMLVTTTTTTTTTTKTSTTSADSSSRLGPASLLTMPHKSHKNCVLWSMFTTIIQIICMVNTMVDLLVTTTVQQMRSSTTKKL